jgi:hypothetical protein
MGVSCYRGHLCASTDELEHVVHTGVFALLLPVGVCYLAGWFYFDIMWLVPWLCSCFAHYCYNDDGFIVLRILKGF